jgi:ABC-type amino acid transport substrate-binding protein
MRKTKYQLSIFAGAAFLSLASLAPVCAADTLSRIRETNTITIAHRESSVPFSYLDENKKPVGYAVDLCVKIADALRRDLKLPNLNVVYLPVSSSSRIPAIVEGKADLECGSTTNNAERRKIVAFTIPHFVAAARMLVRTNSGIKNWADLRNKRVATTKGTTSVKLLTDRDKARALTLKVIEAPDHAESFNMVAKGEADAFPMDDVLLFGLRANDPDPSRFAVVGDALSSEPYAIMMSKDDAAFKELVDREMARIINSGEIYKLYNKWFKAPIPPKGVNLNMPMGHLLRGTFQFPTDKVAD